ncbi:MAG: HPP family protein [Acidiferrobacterales bacterium]
MQHWYKKLLHFLGVERETVSPTEKLVSTLGGILGIILVVAISYRAASKTGVVFIIPSMGASAVLLFGVPHGRLSQPWSVFGGHLVSAVVGVACYKIVPDPFLAAGLAVGLAIGAMHLLSCIHPPGGATALAAVIGGPTIHVLGFGYVLMPTLLNVMVILTVAVVFNSLFPWRRYPASMMRFTDAPGPGRSRMAKLVDKHNIEQALVDMDLIVDIGTEDLQRLFALTLEHAEKQSVTPSHVRLGHYYTNGKHGADWTVRQIIDEPDLSSRDKDMVVYRVVEGRGMRSAHTCTRAEFAQWASRRVYPNHPPAPVTEVGRKP